MEVGVERGREHEERERGQHGRARAAGAVCPQPQQRGRGQLAQRAGAHSQPQRLFARARLQLEHIRKVILYRTLTM